MYDPIATAPGSDTNAARLALRQACSLATTPCLLVSVNGKPVARYDQGRGRTNRWTRAAGGGFPTFFVRRGRLLLAPPRPPLHPYFPKKNLFFLLHSLCPL